MILKKIKDFRERFLKSKYRKKAIKNLIMQYQYERAVDEVLEQWITKRILDGHQGRRNELVEKQNRIKELDLFIDYLKRLR